MTGHMNIFLFTLIFLGNQATNRIQLHTNFWASFHVFFQWAQQLSTAKETSLFIYHLSVHIIPSYHRKPRSFLCNLKRNDSLKIGIPFLDFSFLTFLNKRQILPINHSAQLSFLSLTSFSSSMEQEHFAQYLVWPVQQVIWEGPEKNAGRCHKRVQADPFPAC